MQQHGSKYFARRPPPLDPGGGVKIQLLFFQNMVMLHIKLKGISNEATWYQIFCRIRPSHDPGVWKIKIQLLQNIVMLHIEFKGITNAATW